VSQGFTGAPVVDAERRVANRALTSDEVRRRRGIPAAER
jgi:hypothetical protein